MNSTGAEPGRRLRSADRRFRCHTHDVEAESLESLVADNPWTALSTSGDLVLPGDRAGAEGYALWKTPVPWSGPAFAADVVMLLLNPGLDEEGDRRDQGYAAFRRMTREQLSGTAPFPWCSSQWGATGGGRYWEPRLRDLRHDSSPEAIATRFAVVEWVAYSSRSWVAPTALLESQLFTRRVVRHAISRGAAIVLGRGWRRWAWLVPELRDVPPIFLRSPRFVGPSRGNLNPDDYALILRRLQAL